MEDNKNIHKPNPDFENLRNDPKFSHNITTNSSGANSFTLNNSNINSSTYKIEPYGPAKKIDTIILEDGIEIIYKAERNFHHTTILIGDKIIHSTYPRIWKDVLKFVDGKLKVVETIEGKYLPARDESYEF